MSNVYRSFAITVRPRDGLKVAHENALLAWLRKHPHCVAVREKEGEAMHLHAQIWSMEGWIKGNIVKKLRLIGEKYVENWDGAQAKVQAQGVRIAYDDWATNYLMENEEKDDEKVVLIDNAPDIQEQYYPSEDEQESVKAAANAKDGIMHSWAVLWEEHASDIQKERLKMPSGLLFVGRFCSDIWFKYKLKATLRNDRDQRDFVKRFHAYLNGYCNDEMLLGPKDLEFCCQIEADLDNG